MTFSLKKSQISSARTPISLFVSDASLSSLYSFKAIEKRLLTFLVVSDFDVIVIESKVLGFAVSNDDFCEAGTSLLVGVCAGVFFVLKFSSSCFIEAPRKSRRYHPAGKWNS